MTRLTRIEHRFVETVPKDLEEGVLYVSIPYTTAVHKCACGCGSRVVTPIRPSKWHLTFDGECVTLRPSVGNWSFPCQSHYWIKEDRILWADQMSKRKIEQLRVREGRMKAPAATPASEPQQVSVIEPPPRPALERLRKRLFGR